jgi:ElaB/YqjD/DUF883 family membrane-anchored ribosome-binding protein
MSIAKEQYDELQKRVRSLGEDVAELSRATSAAANKRFNAFAGEVKDKYQKSSTAAREFVEENPAKATLAAGVAGFALGFLTHMIRKRRSE